MDWEEFNKSTRPTDKGIDHHNPDKPPFKVGDLVVYRHAGHPLYRGAELVIELEWRGGSNCNGYWTVETIGQRDGFTFNESSEGFNLLTKGSEQCEL